MSTDRQVTPPTYVGLAWLFLKLGTTAFGGPAAHIAMMDDELVRRRGWLDEQRFLDLLSAANMIPGPSSSELALYIGFELLGVAGFLIAGVCFVLPAALLVSAFAWTYMRVGNVPQVGRALYGIKPVIIAIVLQALWGLGPKALKSKPLAALAALACGASALGFDPLAILLACGLAALGAERLRVRTGSLGLFPILLGGGGKAAAALPVSLVTLGLTFFKIGGTVFGSGYLLLAFLRSDLVDRMHWLTESQLLDAVAIGQLTPGPVFTTATFIGYILAGTWGAVVATLAIFLPGFVLVACTRPLVTRIRGSKLASAFFDGVNAAALALLAVVTIQLAHAALVDVRTLLLAAVSGVLLFRFKLNTAWLIAGGALLGVLS
jgi:chromate transporter